MQAAVIPADPGEMISFHEIADDTISEEISGLAGGPTEPIDISPYAMTMHFGRSAGNAVNHRATVLCNWAGARNRPDHISGDVVLLGPAVDGGHTPIGDTHKWWLIRFDNEQTEVAGLTVGD
ncbi:MAG TPA: hypothetical protein VF885_05780 [Arthrobacter sp.]